MNTKRLVRELRQEGSSQPQAEQLADIAQGLGRLPVPHLDRQAKQAIAEHIGIRPQPRQLVNRLAFAGGLAAIAGVLLTAWFSGPGSHIYGVKGLTNFFHAKAQPVAGQPLTAPSLSPAQPLQPLNESPDSTKAPGSSTATGTDKSTNDKTKTDQQPANSLVPGGNRATDTKAKWYNWNPQPQTKSYNWYDGYDFFGNN